MAAITTDDLHLVVLMGMPGKLVPPYPSARCQASDCGHQLLTEKTEAYLHKNAENGKLLTLCGQCSMSAQLNAPLRLPLIPL